MSDMQSREQMLHALKDEMTETPATALAAFKPCPNPWGCSHKQDPVCTHYNFNGNSRLHHVVCHSCGLRGPIRETEAEAIAAWNTRTPSPAEPVAQAVRAIIERCARLIERKHTNNVGMVHPMAISDAAAIRALADREAPAEPVADAVREELDLAIALIQEAKGAEGPAGGFVTDHLDAAENHLDKVIAALADREAPAAMVEGAAGPWQRVGTFTPDPHATYLVQGVLFRRLKRGHEIDADNLYAALVKDAPK